MQKHNHFYYTTNTGTKYILFTMTGYREGFKYINKVLQELSDKTITFPTTNRLITRGQGHNEPFIHASLATLFSDDCQNNDFTMPSYAMVSQQPIGFLIDKDKCKLLNAYKHDTTRLDESFDSNNGEKRDTKKYDYTITINDFANIYRKQDNHYKNIAEKKPLNIKEQAMVKGGIRLGLGLHNELHLTSIKKNEKIKVYSIFLSFTKNMFDCYQLQLKNLAISLKSIIDKQIGIFGLDTIPLHFVERCKKNGVFKTLTLKELIIFCETELRKNLYESYFNNFIKEYNINFEDITKYLNAKLKKKELQTIQEELKREVIIKNQDAISATPPTIQETKNDNDIQKHTKQLENINQPQKRLRKKNYLKPICIGNNNKKKQSTNFQKQPCKNNLQPLKNVTYNKKIIISNKNNNIQQLQKLSRNNNVKQIIPNKIYQPMRPIIRPTIQNNFLLQSGQQIIPRKNHLKPIQLRYRLQKKPIINKNNNMQQLQKLSRNNYKKEGKIVGNFKF